MRVGSTINVAFRALRRNKLRSALTALGIIIGVGAVIAMVGIGSGAKAQVEAQIASLGQNVIVISSGSTTSSGIRTGWAADHIMKISDIDRARKYFDIVETHFFHFFSMFAFPFRNLPGGAIVFRALDKADNAVLKIPFLKKYAFKVVFVFSAKS